MELILRNKIMFRYVILLFSHNKGCFKSRNNELKFFNFQKKIWLKKTTTIIPCFFYHYFTGE